MARIVEVPLKTTASGKNIGKVRIDKTGRMKIEMAAWVRPDELSPVLDFVRELADRMANQPFSHRE